MTAKIWLRRHGSMRPETMTALSPQIYEYPTVHIRSESRMVQRTPAAPASRSRDSPDVERTSSKAQRFQIWVMSLVLAPTSPDDPQSQRALKPSREQPALALIGVRWAQFTAKTRPNSAPRTSRHTVSLHHSFGIPRLADNGQPRPPVHGGLRTPATRYVEIGQGRVDHRGRVPTRKVSRLR